MRSSVRFARFAWGVLALNTAVILWGAVVRATGSGAGCGSHWPRCDGSIVPVLEDASTAVEFGHRLSSGLAFLAVAALVVMARRRYPAGDRVRVAALGSFVFIVIEVLIGAALVTFGWVDDDTSTARVVAIAVHLANTFLLLGWLALTAWWAGGRPAVRVLDRAAATALAVALAGLVAAGGIGAITALGDTLFPEASFSADFDRSAHYLVRLRVVHPLLAVLAGAYLLALVRRYGTRTPAAQPWGLAVVALVAVQVGLGVVNVALGAPLGMQLVHLLGADALWVAAVLFSIGVLEAPAMSQTPPVAVGEPVGETGP